jgi:hypothetical protein
MRFVVFKIGEAICTMHSVTEMTHNVGEQSGKGKVETE